MSVARLQDILEEHVNNLSIGGLFLTVLLMNGTVYLIISVNSFSTTVQYRSD